jgi:hypothetical protein
MTDCEAILPLQDRLRPVETVVAQSPGVVPEEVFQSDVPVVIRGLTTEWPALNASDLEGMERYLSGFRESMAVFSTMSTSLASISREVQRLWLRFLIA